MGKLSLLARNRLECYFINWGVRRKDGQVVREPRGLSKDKPTLCGLGKRVGEPYNHLPSAVSLGKEYYIMTKSWLFPQRGIDTQ